MSNSWSSPPPSYHSGTPPDAPNHRRAYRATDNREDGPLLPRKTKAGPGLGSPCVIILVTLFLISYVVGATLWGTLFYNRSLERWESDLRGKKAQEVLREQEWERQVKTKREIEELRERQWENQVENKRQQERVREQQWEYDVQQKKAREVLRERRWERHVEDKRQEERLREHEWDLSEEKRERAGLYWDLPTAGKCSAYGVRDYHAQLLNAVPYDYNWLEPCASIPITLHGRSLETDRCEARDGEIWGHWSVEHNPLCTPYFEEWRDMGCIADGSQRRRASARLDNIPLGSDGLELCGSTPFQFWGRHFAHPHTCANRQGTIWGYWEVDDGNC